MYASKQWSLFYMLKHAKTHVALCTLYHTLLDLMCMHNCTQCNVCDTKCCCSDLLYLIGLNDRLMKPNERNAAAAAAYYHFYESH